LGTRFHELGLERVLARSPGKSSGRDDWNFAQLVSCHSSPLAGDGTVAATALNHPILPTLGTIGFEILNDAAGWISGALATSPIERTIWLFCLTSEDRKVVRKRCVRGFLVRKEDMARFHDWQWCREHLVVERPWHWFRIVALHRIARNWADQCRIYSAAPDPASMPLVNDQCGHRRIVSLSLGLLPQDTPISAPFVVDWDHQLESIESNELTLSDGSWPPNLMEQ